MNDSVIIPTNKDNLFYKYEMQDNFFKIIKQINKELNQNNIQDIEYIIVKISTDILLNKELKENTKEKVIEEIINQLDEILTTYSITYEGILNKCYKEGSSAFLFIHDYLKILIIKITEMMKHNHDSFDIYTYITSGGGNEYEELKKEKKPFDEEDIKNTIEILNEAIRVYLNTYKDRTIIASFNSGKTIQFKIKEMQLAHLLGIDIRKIVGNKQLRDILKIEEKDIEALNDKNNTDAAVNILLKIIDIKSGNLEQYEEDVLKDRLKQLIGRKKYTIVENPYNEKGLHILPYKKILVKSKAFIDYKPLDQISMILDMKEGYKIIKMSKGIDQHDILIAKNNISNTFKYTSLATNYNKEQNRRYFQTLMLKSPKDVATWLKDGELASSITTSNNDGVPSSLTKEVYSVPDSGSGAIIGSVFTETQQLEFLETVYKDFGGLNDTFTEQKVTNNTSSKHI